ncbi:MAG TPA: hypothetical protein VGT79_06645 [Xanthomonadaceae bacterium]|nr:hypothetical protein [Xanthomonadaceae bacterium]
MAVRALPEHQLERGDHRIFGVGPAMEAETLGQQMCASAARRVDGIHSPHPACSRDIDQMQHEQGADAAFLPLRIDRHGAVASGAIPIRLVARGTNLDVVAVVVVRYRDQYDLSRGIDLRQFACDAFVDVLHQSQEAMSTIFRRKAREKRKFTRRIV